MTFTRRLLIPLLIFLAIVLMLVQAYQARRDTLLVTQQEEQNLANAALVFQNRLDSLEAFALALSMEVANNPEVQAAFAAKDRERLIELTLPAYEQIDAQFDVPQHQFHLPPATSFLRLHQLDRFDDDLSSFRNTVLAANATNQPTSGPEIGRGGLGIRGVVPVSYEGEHIGTVEFGLNVDQTLINTIKQRFGNDWQILLRQDPAEVAIFEGAIAGMSGPTSDLFLQASTLDEPVFTSPEIYAQVLNGQNVFSPQIEQNDQSFEIYSAPLLDFSGNVIGVIEVVKDRSLLIGQQTDRNLYFVISTFAILIVTALGLGFIIQRMLEPIGKLTKTAVAIAAGDFDNVVLVERNDEIGTLAISFNNMTAQLRNLIGSLEQRVAARTRDLNLAAEIGRQVAQVRHLDQLLPQAAQQVLEQFDLYQTQIYLVDEAGEHLVLASSTGHAGTKLLEAGHTLPIDENSLNGTAVTTKQAVIVADTAESPAFHPNPLLPDTRSEMAVPLLVGDKVVGVLDLQSDKPNTLTEENLPAFETLSGQLAIAIQNAALLNERRQVEAQVRENESLMRTIINSTPDWIFAKDIDHRYMLLNKAFADTLQLPPDEVIGKHDLEIGVPEELVKGNAEKGISGIWPGEREVMDSGQINIIEESSYMPDGRPITLSTVRVPLRDPEGNVSGMVGYIHNITDLKEFEKELQEAHTRTQEILESINVPLVISRISDGIVAYVNEPLAQMIRASREELIGQMTPDFYQDPADRDAYLTGLREQGHVSNFDLNLKRSDGDPLWALASGRVINFQGEPAIITSLVDISDRREAQATVARRAAELETVAQIGTIAATILDPEALLQQVVDLTKERFDLYHAHLYLLNESKTDLILTNGAGEIGTTMVAEGRQIALSRKQSLVARAARTKEGVVINDVQVEPGFLPHPLLPETRAELAVPLAAGNEVQGVLDVQADSVNRFTAEDIHIFTTLASQIAVALQNARRYEEAQRSLDELTRLQRVMAREGWEAFLLAKERPLSGFSFDGKDVKPITSAAKADEEAIETGMDTAVVPEPAVSIPIAIRGEAIGQIELRNPDGSPISARKQAMLQTIAYQVSEALERARLSEQTQLALAETAEQARRRAVLNLTSEQLNRAETLDEIFNIIAENTAQILPSDRVTLAILDEDNNSFSVMSLAGAGENVPVRVEQPLAGSFIEKAIKTGNILVTHDLEPNPVTRIRSSMIVPLVTSSGMIGTLNVGSKADDVYDNLDQGLVLQIASLLSSVIENKRLLTETQERAKELAFINRIVTEINALDIETGLQFLAEELGEILQVPLINVRLVDDTGTTLRVVAAHHPAEVPSPIGTVLPMSKENPVNNMLLARQTVIIEDIANSNLPPQVQKGMLAAGIRSLYMIPMAVGRDLIGSLAMNLLEGGSLLTPDQLKLAETTVQQVATAVQNARLFTQSEERAAELSLINAVSELASSQLELPRLFESVGDLLRNTFASENIYFALYDKTEEMISFPYFFATGDGLLDVPSRSFEQGGYTGQIIAERESLLRVLEPEIGIELAQAEGAQAIQSSHDTDCYLGVPMIVGNEVIGVMGLNSRQEVRTYNEQDQRLLETVADTIGVAIQNIRQFHAAQRQAEREVLINRISQKIQSATTVQSALQTAVSELGQALKLKKATVELSTSKQSNGQS